jgi:S1-C subfamily serine protease
VSSSSDPYGYGGSYGGAGEGATVVGVLAGTPAEAAGLQSGDVIVAVNGCAVASASDLTAVLGAHRPGDQAEIDWYHLEGGAHSATVTLTEGPPA